MREQKFCVLMALLLIASGLMAGVAYDDGDALRLIPDPYHDATVKINVTDAGAIPTTSLAVRLMNLQTGSWGIWGYTDLNGQASFTISSDNWGPTKVIAANGTGVFVDRKDIFIEPDGIYQVDLDIDRTIPFSQTATGVVRNASTGAPLSGSIVHVMGRDDNENYWDLMDTTGPNGKYEIDFPILEDVFTIQADAPGHRSYGYPITFSEGVTSHVRDFDLRPITEPEGMLRAIYLDSETMDPLHANSLYFSGTSSALEHTSIYSDYKYVNSSWWFNIPVDAGEYRMDHYYDMPGFNATLTTTTYFYSDGEITTLEIPVQVPELILITVRVWNGTSPIDHAYVYCDFGTGRTGARVSVGAYTDTHGICHIGVPSDMKVELNAYEYYQGYAQEEFDPSAGITDINLTLRSSTYVEEEKGDVVASIVDTVSGVGVKGALYATRSGPGWSSTDYYQTNHTGVYEGQMKVGFYQTIRAYTTMGTGEIHNVTIASGANPPFGVPITRFGMESPEYPIYTGRIVKENGSPAPFLPLRIITSEPSFWFSTSTDDEGYYRFESGAGSVSIDSFDSSYYPRPMYAIQSFRDELDGTGGVLPDLTCYPTNPLDTVEGHVYDASTGAIMTGVGIQARSYKGLSGHQEDHPPWDENDPILYSQVVGSDMTGYYRVWGMEDIYLDVEIPGYYDYYKRLGGTRGIEHDIYLEPIPASDTYVNGTIVDGNGDPVQGYVYASDADHGDYLIDGNYTGTDGRFSLNLFKGNFTLEYGNSTLMDRYLLEVTGDVEGLLLRLVPRSTLVVNLLNWSGEAIPGIAVEFEVLNGTEYEWALTHVSGPEGTVGGEFEAGTYRLSIDVQGLYMGYVSDPIVLTGWNEVDLDVTLENRTVGDLVVVVEGYLGPFSGEGIPGSTVVLSKSNATVEDLVTGEDGICVFEDLPFDTYDVSIAPPEELLYEEGLRSGYVPREALAIIDVFDNLLTATLDFMVRSSPEYLNVTGHSPKGTGVSLDAPIVVHLSHALDRDTVIGSIVIDPEIGNASVEYMDGDRVIRISGDLLDPNTTYQVRILPTLASAEGYPLWDVAGFEWNFTTGDEVVDWEIFSADVEVDRIKNVTVTVMGKPGIDIFIVIQAVGSYRLTEGPSGVYTAFIPGTNFGWDSLYSYHFSNVSDGEDLAPAFSDTFSTPEEPIPPGPIWHITQTSITVDKDKAWHVTAKGNPGIDIWIVIEGVGSFKLIENSPGNYSVTVPGSMFRYDEEYDYHFSDSDGGPVPSGYESHSGVQRTPKEKEDETPWGVIAGISCLIILIMLLFLAVVLVLVLKSGRKAEDTWAEE